MDGVNWSYAKTMGTQSYIADLLWNGKQYVAVGITLGTPVPIVYTSVDAVNWTVVQTITNPWNIIIIQEQIAGYVAVKDAGFNANIPANGGLVNFGFNLSYSGSNPKPTSFSLNGVACQVQ
jgi:hypothetical protein